MNTMNIRNILIVFFTLALPVQGIAQNGSGCSSEMRAFQPGEKVKYVLTYNWFFVWTDVGEVTFEVNEDFTFDKPTYHLRGVGKTYKFYDWFYQVRDIYESWIDQETLKPVYYKRDVNEDGYLIDITYDYNWQDTVAYSESKKTNHPFESDTIKLPECTYDVMSIIYHARNIDFSKYEIDEKIPLNLLLDSQIEDIYIRYKGKETKKVRKLGKFDCIKFTGYLVKGDVFEGGENLIVWVTDDKNRIPVWIESPIKVGKIKARMVEHEGLKFPLDAKIE
jgi:hypothetical protein